MLAYFKMLAKQDSPAVVKWGVKGVKIALTGVILTLVISLFILVCIPIYVFRLLVFAIGRLLRPDLVQMLTPQSSIMATDSIHTKPEGAFVTKFLMDGEVTKTELESRLQSAVTNEKFVILTQTLEKWMGFYYWKRSDNFELRNQVSFSEDPMTLEEIREKHTNLVDKPFKKGQPLWECVVFNNVTPEKPIREGAKQSVIFFRVHQALADGTSWFNIFSELKMVPEYQTMLNLFLATTNINASMSLKEKIKFGLRIATLGPYNMVREWVEGMMTTKLEKERLAEEEFLKKLGMNNDGNKKGSSKDDVVIEEMYLDNARRIAMSNMAPAGALALSLVAGAIRRIAVEDSPTEISSGFVPKSFKINCPLPIPIPREGLGNYVGYVTMDGPTSTAQPLQRLGAMIASGTGMITSVTPFFSFALMILVGGLNSSLTKCFARRLPLGSVILNTFPGSNLRRKFLDKDVLAITVKSGCPSGLGGACMTFNSIIYKGELSLSMSYPKGLNVGDKIIEEFNLCKSNGNGNSGLLGMNFGALMSGLIK